MEKRTWKLIVKSGARLLLSVFALLLALTGCDKPQTDNTINTSTIYTFYGYTSVKFHSFDDFDQFRKNFQKECDYPFYFLNEDRFEGRVTKYEYRAEDRLSPLVAPFEPYEYIISFEFEENRKICKGSLIVNWHYWQPVTNMTNELFETLELHVLGRDSRDWNYQVTMDNTTIIHINITAVDGFDYDALAAKVFDALVWAYQDQGNAPAREDSQAAA